MALYEYSSSGEITTLSTASSFFSSEETYVASGGITSGGSVALTLTKVYIAASGVNLARRGYYQKTKAYVGTGSGVFHGVEMRLYTSSGTGIVLGGNAGTEYTTPLLYTYTVSPADTVALGDDAATAFSHVFIMEGISDGIPLSGEAITLFAPIVFYLYVSSGDSLVVSGSVLQEYIPVAEYAYVASGQCGFIEETSAVSVTRIAKRTFESFLTVFGADSIWSITKSYVSSSEERALEGFSTFSTTKVYPSFMDGCLLDGNAGTLLSYRFQFLPSGSILLSGGEIDLTRAKTFIATGSLLTSGQSHREKSRQYLASGVLEGSGLAITGRFHPFEYVPEEDEEE